MAKILPDHQIRRMLGKVILDSDERRLNPNGIEMRLGREVTFQSTGEVKELGPGMFLCVRPGESVLIVSYESVVFTREAIHSVFPECDLMAFITPTTTMMREGILQAATKADSGWAGHLNWGLRNSSNRELILQFGEPIFKLTFFLLEGDETPEIPYGERPDDTYQHTAGIARSNRKIPVDIPKSKRVCSSLDAIDPRAQLSEAGYPFHHISTEFGAIDGKFDTVSREVGELSGEVSQLSSKLGAEAQRISAKVDESQRTVLERVENLLNQKFLAVSGGAVGCISLMYAAVQFLQGSGLTTQSVAGVALAAGLGVWVLVFVLSRRSRP